MGIIFNCSFKFLNTILPYIFLIKGFWKKGNGNGIKTFEFNLLEKSLNDQDIQSAHYDIKTLFLNFVCLHNFNFFFTLRSLIKISFWQWCTVSFLQLIFYFLKL